MALIFFSDTGDCSEISPRLFFTVYLAVSSMLGVPKDLYF